MRQHVDFCHQRCDRASAFCVRVYCDSVMHFMMLRSALFVLLVAASALAETPRFDQHGDPLPEGAVTRFGTMQYRVGSGAGNPAVLSPDGKTLANESWNSITLWDVETGRPRIHLKAAHTVAQSGYRASPTPDMCFSSDGKYLVRVVSDDLRVWDVATGRERFAIQLPHGSRSPVFLPGTSKFAFTSGNHPMSIYDAESGQCVETVNVETTAEVLSPSGRLLLGEANGWAVLMDGRTGRILSRFPEVKGTPPCAFSVDYRRIYLLESSG